ERPERGSKRSRLQRVVHGLKDRDRGARITTRQQNSEDRACLGAITNHLHGQPEERRVREECQQSVVATVRSENRDVRVPRQDSRQNRRGEKDKPGEVEGCSSDGKAPGGQNPEGLQRQQDDDDGSCHEKLGQDIAVVGEGRVDERQGECSRAQGPPLHRGQRRIAHGRESMVGGYGVRTKFEFAIASYAALEPTSRTSTSRLYVPAGLPVVLQVKLAGDE